MKSSTYTIIGMKYKVINAKTDGKVDMFKKNIKIDLKFYIKELLNYVLFYLN